MIYDFVFAMSAESDLACTSLPNRSENVSTSYFKDELFVTFFCCSRLIKCDRTHHRRPMANWKACNVTHQYDKKSKLTLCL